MRRNAIFFRKSFCFCLEKNKQKNPALFAKIKQNKDRKSLKALKNVSTKGEKTGFCEDERGFQKVRQ